ncbi:CcmD family protein [Taibaiella sp. KBW10]|nr:CcmD family protein [Taibaiella sp. KBW10]
MAQDSNAVAMADKLRSDGKIYVVVTVIFTIFLGIILYLFTIEKKIKKIEQNQK